MSRITVIFSALDSKSDEEEEPDKVRKRVGVSFSLLPEEEEDEVEIVQTRPTRVAAPAKRPAPGSRAAREAQPSLLDESDGFELPSLSLLAEARHRGPSPEHSEERLEAMARRFAA